MLKIINQAQHKYYNPYMTEKNRSIFALDK